MLHAMAALQLAAISMSAHLSVNCDGGVLGGMLRPRHVMQRYPIHWAETEAENNPKEKIT